MIDLDDIAITRFGTNEADAAGGGGEDRRANRAAEIEPGVHGAGAGERIAAIAKARRHHQHIGGVARGDGDEGAFEHLHAEQRAFERGERCAERLCLAHAALVRDERTTAAGCGAANDRGGIEPELRHGRFGIGGAFIDRCEQPRGQRFLARGDARERLCLGRQAWVDGTGFERRLGGFTVRRVHALGNRRGFGTEICFLPLFQLVLPLLEISGGFGDAVAILCDALFRFRCSRRLLCHGSAFVGAEQLVDQHGERCASPGEQHDTGDQRDALLPDSADSQEADMAVRANEDFMVLKQRREALAPMAQARRFR